MLLKKNVPDWIYYQINGKTAEENYLDIKQKQHDERQRELEIEEEVNRRVQKIIDNGLEEKLDKSLDKALDKALGNLFK